MEQTQRWVELLQGVEVVTASLATQQQGDTHIFHIMEHCAALLSAIKVAAQYKMNPQAARAAVTHWKRLVTLTR